MTSLILPSSLRLHNLASCCVWICLTACVLQCLAEDLTTSYQTIKLSCRAQRFPNKFRSLASVNRCPLHDIVKLPRALLWASPWSTLRLNIFSRKSGDFSRARHHPKRKQILLGTSEVQKEWPVPMASPDYLVKPMQARCVKPDMSRSHRANVDPALRNEVKINIEHGWNGWTSNHHEFEVWTSLVLQWQKQHS